MCYTLKKIFLWWSLNIKPNKFTKLIISEMKNVDNDHTSSCLIPNRVPGLLGGPGNLEKKHMENVLYLSIGM